ncbi:MAG: hypothetical protein WD398_12270 [Cyclobacteriaceae bacterium]
MTKNYTTDIFLDKRLKKLTQEYSAYTAEDFKVWKILFERQYKSFEELYQSIPEIEEKLAILLEKSEKED